MAIVEGERARLQYEWKLELATSVQEERTRETQPACLSTSQRGQPRGKPPDKA